MKQVQEALKDIGIPVMAGVWRASSSEQNPPPQYAVYSSTTTEAAHQDDQVQAFRTYVYLNLWSDSDPTETAAAIRNAMYRHGFSLIEESDKGKDARRMFLDGYNEMMARLMPTKIIFFGNVPKECEGNIEHHAPYYETFTRSLPFHAR